MRRVHDDDVLVSDALLFFWFRSYYLKTHTHIFFTVLHFHNYIKIYKMKKKAKKKAAVWVCPLPKRLELKH
jgi:hypothetical protein